MHGIVICNYLYVMHLKSDLSSVLKELSSLNSSISPDCVKDNRLGKYRSEVGYTLWNGTEVI